MFSRKTAADFFGGAEEIISRSDGSRLVNANKKAESYQSKTLLFYVFGVRKSCAYMCLCEKKAAGTPGYFYDSVFIPPS